MAKVYDGLDTRLRQFIAEQPVFFVASAPSSGGHVNLSPKGHQDTIAVLDEHTVAYLDLFGSGAETIAHIRENGRVTIMFCSFGRTPKILRLYGTGRLVRPDDPEWDALMVNFGAGHPGNRMIVVVTVDRIADSCGFAVPRMDLVGERDMLDAVHGRRTAQEWLGRREVNAASMDGLPSLAGDHPLPKG